MVEARRKECLLGGAVGDALGAPVEFLSLDVRHTSVPEHEEDRDRGSLTMA